jgi:hypothetical protein
MQNLILCDLKKNGPDSSSEAKVMVVLSLDSESGFLARCWKSGGFGFVDRVGFRDRIYFVNRVGCRDMIYFVDRVGFRDRNCAKAKAMVLGRNKLIVIIFFVWLFVDYGTKQN